MTWLALSVTSSKQRFVVKEQNPQGKYQGYTWLALSVTSSKQTFVVKEQNPQGKYQGYTWLALSVTSSKPVSYTHLTLPTSVYV